MTEGIDIALCVDRLRPGADWGAATTYADLQRTWRDVTTIPSEVEIETAWAAILAERAAADARKVWPNAASFLQEFSLEKLAAIELSTNPTIAALRLVLASWHGQVWSDDVRILLGLAALVSEGILTEEEKTAILAK